MWLSPVWRGEVLSAFQALHDFSAPALEMLRAASRLEVVRSDGDAEVHELDDALRTVASAAADGPIGACFRSLVFGTAVPLDVAVTALLQTLPQEQRLILRSVATSSLRAPPRTFGRPNWPVGSTRRAARLPMSGRPRAHGAC